MAVALKAFQRQTFVLRGFGVEKLLQFRFGRCQNGNLEVLAVVGSLSGICERVERVCGSCGSCGIS
jgi:hypothetical protein